MYIKNIIIAIIIAIPITIYYILFIYIEKDSKDITSINRNIVYFLESNMFNMNIFDSQNKISRIIKGQNVGIDKTNQKIFFYDNFNMLSFIYNKDKNNINVQDQAHYIEVSSTKAIINYNNYNTILINNVKLVENDKIVLYTDKLFWNNTNKILSITEGTRFILYKKINNEIIKLTGKSLIFSLNNYNIDIVDSVILK